MNSNNNRRRDIKLNVAKAEFELALKLLLDEVSEFCPDLEEEAVSVSARYYYFKKEKSLGTIGWKEGETYIPQIAIGILGVLKSINNYSPQA